jgi:hypothetical protein
MSHVLKLYPESPSRKPETNLIVRAAKIQPIKILLENNFRSSYSCRPKFQNRFHHKRYPWPDSHRRL